VPDLVALQKILGFTFNDTSLLETALTHSSFVNESSSAGAESNERLEFLGDAILGFIVAEKLYQDFSELSEGEMTKLRAALVRRDTLARVAQDIRLGDFLYLGKGEEASGGRLKTTNLAGALEAVIAAVFLVHGAATTRSFIFRLLSEELVKVGRHGAEIDYKSQLQELMQSRQQLTPVYRLIETAGPEHDRRFTIEVMAGDTVLGRGTGKSKKQAEVEAARLAWQQLSASFTG
jgi:ribonuclease-3